MYVFYFKCTSVLVSVRVSVQVSMRVCKVWASHDYTHCFDFAIRALKGKNNQVRHMELEMSVDPSFPNSNVNNSDGGGSDSESTIITEGSIVSYKYTGKYSGFGRPMNPKVSLLQSSIIHLFCMMC